MSMTLEKEKNRIKVLIPNSEATVEAQIKNIKDSEVTGFYTSDKEDIKNNIVEFLKSDYDYIICVDDILQLINELSNFKDNFGYIYKDSMNSLEDSFNYFNVNKNKYLRIPKMYYSGVDDRYFKFDNQDSIVKKLRSILYGDITGFYIIKNNENKQYIISPFIRENAMEILNRKKEKLTDRGLRQFYIENLKNNIHVESMIKQREKFILEYPLSRLLEMSLEEYCLGVEGYKDTFCNKLESGEYKSTGFGIKGAIASKFGIYLKKDNKYHGKNDILIDDPISYWEEYRKQLYDFLVEMGTEEPSFSIDEKYNLLGGKGGYMYLTKLLSLYYPNRFISMAKDEAYEKLNAYLNIPNRANAVCNSYYSNIAFRKCVPEANDNFDYYISNAIWKYFKMNVKEEGEDIMKIDESSRLHNAYNKIFYGIPGCGKSWHANDFALKCSEDEKMIIRTTFYPDYTNGDFVGQIIPKIGENNSVLYDIQSGPFTEALVKAIDNPNQYVCLIVEEINRGNAAAIFGDLFQLLDRNESGSSAYWVKNYIITEYLKKHCLNKSYDVENIRIPSNLYIIGTMNTSDQNVFTLDTAFKRRWKMEYIQNNVDDCIYANETIPLSNVTWSEFVKEINNFITGEFGLDINGEDKQIGSYFISSAEWNDIKTTSDQKEAARIFAEKILSYIWDDVAKINRESWFDGNKYRTLDSLVKGFTEKGLEIFGDNISFTREKNDNGNE